MTFLSRVFSLFCTSKLVSTRCTPSSAYFLFPRRHIPFWFHSSDAACFQTCPYARSHFSDLSHLSAIFQRCHFPDVYLSDVLFFICLFRRWSSFIFYFVLSHTFPGLTPTIFIFYGFAFVSHRSFNLFQLFLFRVVTIGHQWF